MKVVLYYLIIIIISTELHIYILKYRYYKSNNNYYIGSYGL